MQFVLVDRKSFKSRVEARMALKDRASNPNWQRICFFEGTCGKRTAIMKFRVGAYTPGVPVQPIILRWNNEIAWTGGSRNRMLLILRSLCEVYHSAQVEFLPIYIPSQEEQEDPQ